MDASVPDSAVTDISMVVLQANSLIEELSKMGDVGDVAREIQRIVTTLTTSSQAERQSVQQNMRMTKDIELARAELLESKSVITDLLAMKNSVSDDVKRSMMELGDVKARVGEGTARVGALTASIEGLNAQLTVGPGWTPAQKAKFANLQGTRTDLRAGLDVKRAAMATLRRDVDIAMNAVELSQKANAEVRGEIDGVKDDTQASVAKAAKLTVAQGRQTAELKGAQAEVEVAHVEAEAREALVAQGDAALKRMEAALKARKAEVERVLQEYAALHAKTAATTAELDSQLATNETLSQDIQRIRAHIEEFRKEEHAFVTEVERCVALHGLAAKRLAETSQQLVEVEEEASKLQEESASYRKESDVISRSNEALQRSLQDLIKERDILRGSIEKMSDNTVAVETLMAAARSSQKMTESETLTLHKNVRDVREGIEDMHDQLAALEEKFLEANRRVIRTQEQIAVQVIHEQALKKKIIEQTRKLKQQQSVYDSARDERNAYSKSLLEVEGDIAGISRQFKNMTKMIDNSKDEIAIKDHELVKEHFDHHKVEKEKEAIRSEALKLKRQIKNCGEIMEAQEAEKIKLNSVVGKADTERVRQQKEFAAVIGERDSLRSQVIQRDAELSTLYEKLKIQRSMLDKGTATYESRKEVEREERRQIAKLKLELQKVKLQIAGSEGLKQEVLRLEKDIRAQQYKSTVLEMEAINPINVHRWRQLEATQPEMFARIQRLQNLQKRLLECSDEISQREALTVEKEALYKELKLVLDRQPGTEVAEQVEVLKQALKQKKKQLAGMEAEMATFKAAMNDNKFELDRTVSQIQRLEKLYVSRFA